MGFVGWTPIQAALRPAEDVDVGDLVGAADGQAELHVRAGGRFQEKAGAAGEGRLGSLEERNRSQGTGSSFGEDERGSGGGVGNGLSRRAGQLDDARRAVDEGVGLFRLWWGDPLAGRTTGQKEDQPDLERHPSVARTDVVLRLADGTAVAARVERHVPEELRGLFTKRVVVAGLAQYRPSGRLLVIDAEHIGLATPGDALWEQSPAPRPVSSVPVAHLVSLDDSTGVAVLFGTWPGDECDEEFCAALAGIR
jgi:hypothetical protein